MKKKTSQLFTAAILSSAYLFFGAACSEEPHHESDGHDHGEEHHEGDGHEHGESEDHEGEGHEHSGDKAASHEGHEHERDTVEAGPHGGRILHAVEPHLEFFVTDDRKVEIYALGENGQTIPMENQSVNVIGGDRSNPTRMNLTREGDKLVSDIAFPEGNDFPVVVRIKATPDAKAETVKFNLNLVDCPTCDYREYACVCDHEHAH